MSTFKTFEEITAWQKARALTRRIYDVTARDKFRRDFGLVDQIRRASVSAMSNIAEGFERRGGKEFAYFLSVAKGSLGELRAQLYVASDQGYIDKPTFEELSLLTGDTARMIGGLARYLRQHEAAKRQVASDELRVTRENSGHEATSRRHGTRNSQLATTRQVTSCELRVPSGETRMTKGNQ